ncbi:glycine cleavage system aminomethyltransferase T [Corynebacterium kalinowskii]|uniref:Glycine cleavage system aminomethyltransferase T n=1 Tax=Corynebacterium kalinowskii TaxID=2675216 RepID=A0A6B8VNG1_9CORY|nr:glycine cleavage system aminomethyltransferase T [Corynebacterium kalinowskii]
MPPRLRATIGFVTSTVSPLLSRPGATGLVEDSPIDHAGVAWHYGAPLVEQGQLPAVVDRSHRAVIAVSGPDAATFLNNLLSQKLDDAPDGFSASALDLDSQGRILHHADVALRDGTFYLDVPASQSASLLSYLQKMVFWSEVTITDTDLAILTLLGDLPLPDCVFARHVAWSGPRRVDIAVSRSLIDATVTDLQSHGAALMGLMGFTAERVKALEPELGADLDDKSIPHEAPTLIERAVHLEKGCYRGQETVSRVHNLGRSPRVLVLLHLDGSAPALPSPGDPIVAGSRTVGRLGTVVHDHELGPIALGLVKRSALGSELMSGETALAVDLSSVPDDSAERPGRAAINRLRGMGVAD